jgi:hypothetical protein
LRGKTEELSTLDARFRQTVAENEQLAKRLREAGEVGRRAAEYENKMALLGKEI